MKESAPAPSRDPLHDRWADARTTEFDLAAGVVPLNHAAVAPLCRRSRDLVRAWADDLAANGDLNLAGWWRRVEETRAGVAAMINATPAEIAFTKNTSEAVGLVAEGFDWRPGDNVVVPEGEYPANVYPWLHLARKGVSVRWAPVQPDGRIWLEDLAAAIDGRTRLLAISWVQYASGFRSDLDAVGRLCRAHGVELLVDAIQGLGVFPLDVEAAGVDYLATDAHKWMLGPEGAGVLYVRRARQDALRPTTVGWKSVRGMFDYGTIDFTLKDDAQRYECGTYHMACLAGLSGCVALLNEVGPTTIAAKVRRLTDGVVDRLLPLHAEVFSPRVGDEWSGIVSFSLPGRDPENVVQACRRAGVLVSNRGGRVRASPHFYNTDADLDRLAAALRTS
ncbi:MAG: aminotransferase class V-fold PLP-dependent enzyme [Planctomycetia bacterium]